MKVMARTKTNNNDMSLKYTNIATLLTFVSPNGKCFASFYILKAGNSEQELQSKLTPYYPNKCYYVRGSSRRFFCFTKKGYVVKDVFNDIMKKFVEIWTSENAGMHCYVFGDQLEAHKDFETVKMCYEKNVFMWSLPANTSHFLQPLDNLCFAVLKSKFKSKLYELNLRHYLTNSNIRQELFAAMYEAEEESMIPSVIKSSFKNTGIYPFDPEKIRKLTNDNCGKLIVSKVDMVNELSQCLTNLIHDVSNNSNANYVTRDNPKIEFLNSPQKIIELKEKKNQTKKEKDQIRHEKKRKREEEVMKKIERRIRNKCIFIECTVVKQEKSTWEKCSRCNRFICPKHSKQKAEHELTCTHDYME